MSIGTAIIWNILTSEYSPFVTSTKPFDLMAKIAVIGANISKIIPHPGRADYARDSSYLEKLLTLQRVARVTAQNGVFRAFRQPDI